MKKYVPPHKRESYIDEEKEIFVKWQNRYSNKNVQQRLENVAKENEKLVDLWILNKNRNPFYNSQGGFIKKKDLEYYSLIDWTIPNIKYKYKIFNEDETRSFFKKCVLPIRSAIIPLVKKEGKNYWLLGSFHDYEKTKDPILIDFGGKCEKQDERKDQCPALSCALRETEEESKGLLTPYIKEKLNNYDNIVLIEGGDKEVIFIFVLLDYEDVKDIPDLFLSSKKEKKENLGPLGFYEQNDIKSRKYRTSKNLTDLVSFLNNMQNNTKYI